MIDRTTRLRWRRRFRRSRQQVGDLGVQAENQLERNFFRRLSKLTQVRRFVVSWVLLLLLIIGLTVVQIRALSSHYLSLQPAPGGVYTEGILGSFTNVNPLYATNNVDSSVERLVFSGLFKIDQSNQLVGDLAKSWEVDERGTVYTVKLKPNLKWQDGQPLTSSDVAYTYQMVQNPDAKSPLASSWQGIKVETPDANTIVFTLPSILSAFPYSMVNGIIPKHILSGIPPSQLRSVPFDSASPIGSGPFKWETAEVISSGSESREQRIALVPNSSYVGGTPKLDKFIVRAFHDQKDLENALKSKELTAAVGLSTVPDEIQKSTEFQDYNVALTSEVMIFLKNSQPPFNDIRVRSALAQATDTKALLENIGRPVLPARSPLLLGQLGYDKSIVQSTGDLNQANKLLDDAGWKPDASGKRVKDGQPLSFKLTTQSDSIYDYVAQTIKQQWQRVGVTVDVNPLKDTELQEALTFHTYDALLYGIALGPDPDVFAFWHSSQADLRSANHLNLSEYKSPAADKALEAGRTRSEASVRAVKYKPFLEAWRNDVPAIALYQPRFLYIVQQPLYNFQPVSINSAADRFSNVQNWMIRQTKQPIK